MRKIYLIIISLSILLFSCESSELVDPSTIIQYSIPVRANVKITIENSYNTVIKILVDGEQSAGLFKADFSATDLAAGVYFYTIEVKGIDSDYYYKSTKQMLLIK